MPISQRTYELQSVFLMDAMGDAQVRMIRMHGGLLEMLSKNPGATLEYIRASDRGATALARRFRRASVRWSNKDVPEAYLKGIQHANTKASAFRASLSGKTPKALSSPLLPQARLATGVSIGGGIPKGFKPWPNHLGMVKVFQGNARDLGRNLSLQLLRGSRDIAQRAALLAGNSLFREGAVFTRRAMSRKMLGQIAKKGVGFVTYANGARVSLDSYAEMAARTMSGRAAVTGSLARYQEMGVDLVQVSTHFRTCDLCAPWEGRILSQSGDGKHPAVQTAIDSGLLHPNCAHDIFPYVPGVKKLEVRKHPAEKRIGRRKAFQAQAQQRHIERKTREWKRQLAGDRKIPLPPGVSGHRSARKVQEWQAKMRAHLDANPFLPRKRYREQITRLGRGVTRRPVARRPGQALARRLGEAKPPPRRPRIKTRPPQFKPRVKRRQGRTAPAVPDKAQLLQESLAKIRDPDIRKWATKLVDEGLVGTVDLKGFTTRLSPKGGGDVFAPLLKGITEKSKASVLKDLSKKLEEAYAEFKRLANTYSFAEKGVKVKEFWLTQYKESYAGLANGQGQWMSVNPKVRFGQKVPSGWTKAPGGGQLTDSGMFTVGAGQGSSTLDLYLTTLRHEYAHIVDGQMMAIDVHGFKNNVSYALQQLVEKNVPGKWKAWAKKNLSKYSAENEFELFAEAFAAISDARYVKGTLPRWFEEFFEQSNKWVLRREV